MSHPTGNENVRAAAIGLCEAGILAKFHTTIATFPGDVLDRISAFGPFAEFGRRSFDPVLKSATQTWGWREAGRLAASKIGINILIRRKTGPFSVDAVYQSLDRRVALTLRRAFRKEVCAVYSYEDASAFSFKEAKSLGIKCFYDLPIGYWRAGRRILEMERERWPDWVNTLPSYEDSVAKLARKDEELRLADRIFVASKYTAQTLQEFPGVLAPIEVIPYGFPPVGNSRNYSTISRARPVKLLYVGSLTQRKGIADLFAAVESLINHVELTVVGRKEGDDCSSLNAALARHVWIPSLSHDKILKLMRNHDVLVLPSLFEGFGLVITEAMSQGTPVITTERTAGPDLITHGQNGWLVQAGSTQALKSSIEDILYHPRVIAEAGRKAMETARSRPWKVYGKELAEAVGMAF
ncbi:MAG: glycosyltransferase family 4 protein [Chitinophagaceae bacterium]